MSRSSGVVFAAAAFGVGLVIGLAFAPIRDAGRNVSERQEKRSGGTDSSTDGLLPADELESQALRRENERMRRRLEQLEGNSPAEGDSELKDAQLAQEIYEAMSSPNFHTMKDKNRWMATLGNLAKLKPAMAAYFIEKYRNATAPGARTIGLQLAIACGGPDTVALLKELLGGPAVSSSDRAFAAMALTGEALIDRPSQMTIDSELWAIAERNRASSEFIDRLSAVGVFGMRESVESRNRLLGFCSQDSDVRVRIAALRALGRIGDRQTYDQLLASGVAILESLPPQPTVPQVPGNEQQPAADRLRQAFDRTLREIEARFPN